jgi:hypothetical protein
MEEPGEPDEWVEDETEEEEEEEDYESSTRLALDRSHTISTMILIGALRVSRN